MPQGAKTGIQRLALSKRFVFGDLSLNKGEKGESSRQGAPFGEGAGLVLILSAMFIKVRVARDH